MFLLQPTGAVWHNDHDVAFVCKAVVHNRRRGLHPRRYYQSLLLVMALSKDRPMIQDRTQVTKQRPPNDPGLSFNHPFQLPMFRLPKSQ